MSRRLRVKLDKMRDNGASLCQGCLSSDRVLYSIGEYDELNQIIIDNSLFNSNAVLLCWECATVLNKMKRFKEQVRHAANILTLQRKNLITTVPKSLSKLSKYDIKAETVLVFENDTEFDSELDEKKKIIKLEPLDSRGTTIDNKKEFNLLEPNTFDSKDLNINTFLPDTLTDNDKTVSSENSFAVKEEIDDDDDHDGFETEDSDLLAPLKNEIEINKEKEIKKTDTQCSRFDKYTLVEHFTKQLIFKDKINVYDISTYMKMERDGKFFVKTKFKCEKCMFKFKTEEALDKHNLIEHDLSLPYKCEHCQTCFASDTELQDHGKKHLICYRCRACTFECYTYSSMKAHVRIHKGCIKCKICGAFERNVREFYMHYNKYHKVFCCEYCGKKYTKKEYLQKHIIYHQKITCDVCGSKVMQNHLAKHKRRVHTVDRTELSYCVTCNKQYDNEYKLQAHYKHTHNQRVKREFKCAVCEKIYASRFYMKNHYRLTHEKKTKNYCVDCDKYFITPSKYKVHIAYKHEGKERPKEKICNFCGKGFSHNAVLFKHIRTHTGERPYQCMKCKSAFNQRAPLIAHLKKIHNYDGPIPYSAQGASVVLNT